MTEMVERVARAICDAQLQDPDDLCGGDQPQWLVWRDHAIAAITAMREPTDQMKAAAWAEQRNIQAAEAEDRPWDFRASDQFRHMFNAAIDAALKESEGQDAGR